jgi:predicted Zn-dependent protease with MMP-like domain
MDDRNPSDPDLEPLEEIYDALDAGEPEQALALAREALAAGADQDPVLHFLCGVALFELDDPDGASKELLRATELDPDDAEARAHLAEAHYRCCRFDAAEREARAAVRADDTLPHGHWALGLALERRGRYDEAEREFARAARLAPDEFWAPVRFGAQEFERHLRETIDGLPEPFRGHLDQVSVTVDDLPSLPVLTAEEPPLDPELLGLFVGVARTERSVFSAGGELPPRILLFKRNLERVARDADELREEIAVTLRHELAHYLGLEEDEIEQAGHA